MPGMRSQQDFKSQLEVSEAERSEKPLGFLQHFKSGQDEKP